MPHPDLDQPLRGWTAVETATAIRRREVAVTEVVTAAIERMQAWEPILHAMVTTTPERALADAARIDDALTAGVVDVGSMAGVPTVVKDLSDLAGVETRQGSRAITGMVPTANGVEVDELLSSGMVNLGKSATPEFGLIATTEPLFGDPTSNPWAPTHSAGGSSGGAGALVAAGVVPIAHATDGGGSIRIPAAVNGLVGLKPTVGRHVQMRRMRGLPIKISVSNVVTRTVADTAAHMAALERHHRATHLPPVGIVEGPARRRLRIGVAIDGPNAPTAPSIAAATRDTADRLAGLGHHVSAIDLPFGKGFGDDFVLYWASLAQVTVRLLPRSMPDTFDRDLVDPFTATLADHARANMRRIPGAIRRLRAAGQTYREVFTHVDVILTPTLAQPTPRLGATSPRLGFDELTPWLMDYAQFTPLHNTVGSPAISVPAGHDAGLPIGVQLAALPGDDRTLLELAYALEEAAPWPLLAPIPTRSVV
ncbi:MAG TPA: amidase [Nitriliruptoraceae bacterium]|nr:amidase [Nitriliruptoraceae bacterium]